MNASLGNNDILTCVPRKLQKKWHTKTCLKLETYELQFFQISLKLLDAF